ncbi:MULTISPECIES: Hsp33 family molecular chaperone HslO [unclassified Sphingobium]|uniref:Hsp33 family molecular chaperone HslO n=1 Tax=unclassified Sphingobium TaxID=2611147 RepID=UPI000D156E38|nr:MULTISPECIES: Hsp33 family molecular chaperone HslO [unclassified Sphingobium]MBG6117760.1 molecular chaperone Hsp33 [Sphingobium sp. JAI105]PSO12397.1 molecular chaperone Hsp33 [Sphingobium sp. AEW4]TWD08404.1 molecular chaperone Hsp33 [Sphingobium sp. AEW010]TWD25965.1 molecular chaperone Hsp33 [Sphingobium sp. AEW013]TWD28200.1 molecular chaperone Hsp33 [Sphingobium sp. AEW001]
MHCRPIPQPESGGSQGIVILPPHIDHAIGFTIPSRHARGRIVRLGPVLDQVLAAHAYPPPIERLLASALVLAALLGSTLKQAGGQLTLQAQTETGVVRLLVADYKNGELRGYAKFDADRLAELGPDPTLFGLFGKGYLAITFDQALTGERYQGIVPLDGETLADAAEQYFFQSEQIPSIIRMGTRHDAGQGCIAGGMLIQHLPEGEVGRERLHVRHDHPEWEHVQALGITLGQAELTDETLPLTDIVWRLFHEEPEVRVMEPSPLAKGCRCDIAHIRDVIGRFPAEERVEMAGSDGIIGVDCAFCSRIFPLALDSFTAH